MIEKPDREQRVPPDEGGRVMAELLWKYIDELKQAENPDDVQFVAITRGECAEVVGLMETAAEAYVLARTESAPHCRREAIRRRLHAVMEETVPTGQPMAPPAAARRPSTLPAWLTAPLTGRSTGWAVAVAALVALLWVVIPRPTPVIAMPHAEAVQAIPKLVNGTLDPEDSRALLAHLIECDDCMALYKQQRAAYLRAHPSRQSRLPGGFTVAESLGGNRPRSAENRLLQFAVVAGVRKIVCPASTCRSERRL
jgi:hypothetical protein